MKTFDFFGLYVGFLWLQPGTPVIHTWELNEIDAECRTSTAHFLRLWPTRLGLAFGRWQKSGMTGPEMFAHVFTTRELDLLDADGQLHPQYARAARETIAGNVGDPDEEWEILRMTGLDK